MWAGYNDEVDVLSDGGMFSQSSCQDREKGCGGVFRREM